MSGNTQNTLRVVNQLMPNGNVAITLPYVAQTGSGGPDILDLTYALTNKKIDQIQAVFIDNSEGSETFVIEVQSTRMKLKCPAFTQGWFPFLVSYPNGGELTFTGAQHTTPIFLLNVPMPVGTWDIAASSETVYLDWISYSQDIGPVTVAAIPEDVTRSRKNVFIKAPETDDLWVNRIGGPAGIDLIDCFKIPLGEIYENEPGQTLWEQWSFYCATAASNATILVQPGV